MLAAMSIQEIWQRCLEFYTSRVPARITYRAVAIATVVAVLVIELPRLW